MRAYAVASSTAGFSRDKSSKQVASVVVSPNPDPAGKRFEALGTSEGNCAFDAEFSSVRVRHDDLAVSAPGSLAAGFSPHRPPRPVTGSLQTPRDHAVGAHAPAAPLITQAPLRIGAPDDRAERFATAAAQRVIAGTSADLASIASMTGESGVIRRQIDPDRPAGRPAVPAQPMQGLPWTQDAVSINITPAPSGTSSARAGGSWREPVWCQFGGYDREECQPLQACRTTSASTFVIDAIYRVDGRPPAPEYPRDGHSQPITVAGEFVFEPSSGGDRNVSSFSQTVRYAGRGIPVHTHRFQFSSPEDGLLSVSLRVGTPAQVVIYNGSAQCQRVDCV